MLIILALSLFAKWKEAKKKKNRAMFLTYKALSKRVFAIMEDEDTTTDVKKFAKEIRQTYIEKKISAEHYYDLMKYLSSHYFFMRNNIVLRSQRERG